MESAFLLLSLHPLRALQFSKQHFLKGGFSQEHFFFLFSNPPNKCAMKRFRHSMVSWGKGVMLQKELKDESGDWS